MNNLEDECGLLDLQSNRKLFWNKIRNVKSNKNIHRIMNKDDTFVTGEMNMKTV